MKEREREGVVKERGRESDNEKERKVDNERKGEREVKERKGDGQTDKYHARAVTIGEHGKKFAKCKKLISFRN